MNQEIPLPGCLTGVHSPILVPADMRGVTGPGGPRLDLIKEDEWYNPKLHKDGGGSNWYQSKNFIHCHFKPALIHADGKETWAIRGAVLNPEEIAVVKQILNDVKLAPLYINHPLFKYTARHMLENHDEKTN